SPSFLSTPPSPTHIYTLSLHDALPISFPSAGAAFVAVSKGSFVAVVAVGNDQLPLGHGALNFRDVAGTGDDPQPVEDAVFVAKRSEEHTSELQSRSDLVCRLLLEKKKY